MHFNARWVLLPLALLSVLTMAPGRCRESTSGFFSGDPAPDLRGEWAVTYDDTLNVEINVGGQVYSGSVMGTAGSFEFTHEGETYTFELDCAEPALICPSEVFAETVTLEQRRFEDAPHQVHMPAAETRCVGRSRAPDEAAGECGGETDIPCDVEICEGTVTETESVSLGSISEPDAVVGDTPPYTISLALGGLITAFATSYGVCIGMAGSHAEADIEYDGTYDTETNGMIATRLANGEVVMTLGGACLVAGAGGGAAGVALAGAEIQIWTGFEATPVD